MVRRFAVVAVATALVMPVLTARPASAALLFSCPSIDPDSSYTGFGPPAGGLKHDKDAQDAFGQLVSSAACSNGETFGLSFGDGNGFNRVTTTPTTPIGCPVAWGGAAGNDYPDKTKILLGVTDPAFGVTWGLGGSSSSTGILKIKAGPTGTEWRLVFVITGGKYAPPPGQKTKIKATVTIDLAPYPGFSYTCADDSDPLEGPARAGERLDRDPEVARGRPRSGPPVTPHTEAEDS
jgi:hypothetical protein